MIVTSIKHLSLHLSSHIFTEEYDEYDREFDKMREATLKTRGVQAKEELASATKHVEECRKHLDYAREQVCMIVLVKMDFVGDGSTSN